MQNLQNLKTISPFPLFRFLAVANYLSTDGVNKLAVKLEVQAPENKIWRTKKPNPPEWKVKLGIVLCGRIKGSK